MNDRDRTTPVVTLREADGNDLEGVVDVGRRTWRAVNGPLFEDDLAELLLAKWWTSDATIPAIRAGRTLVAETDGRIVGMASYGPHEGSQVIWKLYVLPEYQGLGIGGRLLEEVAARVADLGETLLMSYNDGNVAAGPFAVRHGFVEDSREEQTSMPDLIWMRREAAAPAAGTDDA